MKQVKCSAILYSLPKQLNLVPRSSRLTVQYFGNLLHNWSYVSVKSKVQHAPPQAFHFCENYCSNSPLPGPKCRSNAPHWGPFRWSNAPTPGTFHRHKNDRRTAETPSVVEQNLYKYNKNWETLLAYLLRTKVSSKAAEIAATRSLNVQLFLVMQHTKCSIKKDPTYWDYYIMTISLICIIAHLIN